MMRISVLYTLIFCLLLLSVPVVQVVHEKRSGERVQALDIIEDAFVTPGKRTVQITSDLQKILASCNRIQTAGIDGDGDLYEMAEELLADAENGRRHYIECNRHISDSLLPERYEFDSLVQCVRTLMGAVDKNDGAALMTAAAICSKKAGVLYARLSPASVGRSLRSIVHAFFTTTIFNNNYLRAYEKELEDRSVVAGTVRPIMQFLRYKLLADRGEKVIGGKDGWLFYRADMEYCYRPSVFDPRSRTADHNDNSFTDTPLEAITDFRDQLASRNIDLLVVVVPGKPSIYPDKLGGSSAAECAAGVSPSDRFLDTLRRHGIATVDLFSRFRSERKNDSLAGERMYLSLDTHWKERGLRCAADLVVQKIRTYTWYTDDHFTEEYMFDTVVVDREGDIGVMTDLSSNSFERLRIPFAPEPTRCLKVFRLFRDRTGNVLRKEEYRDDFKNARVLLLGDSFSRIYQTDAPGSAGFIAHIAASLSEPIASLVSDGGASTLVREKLARNSGILKGKRLVVWEFVERDIRFGAFGWKRVMLP